MTEPELLQEIRELVAQSSQKQVAKELRVTAQYLCDVLKKRRGISGALAGRLGYTRIVTFEPVI